MKPADQGRATSPKQRAAVQSRRDAPVPMTAIFAFAFGCFLGLTLLKFGNPPIFEKSITAPGNMYEFLLGYPWPLRWAFVMVFILSAWGGAIILKQDPPALQKSVRWPKWLLFLPIVWLGWQVLATIRSGDTTSSGLVLAHFTAAVSCFYLGALVLARTEHPELFWVPVISCFLLVLAAGLEQKFGGLEATRRYFFAYGYAQVADLPPEFIKKLNSERIFGTLFYPNALAGALLLLTPAMLNLVWRTPRTTVGARGLLEVIVLVPVLGCLYWSGSKAGWLLALILIMAAVLKSSVAARVKYLMLALALAAGLGTFTIKYASFFKKGATSVVARFDYWTAAVKIAADHPLLGSGPGTFGKEYRERKRPESEMARLTHNDYLEQASDSGILGFLAYTTFIWGALIWTGRKLEILTGFRARIGLPNEPVHRFSWATFAVWLGVVAWALQGFVEFGLYIPALAWPAFAFLGHVVGTAAHRIND